ncbi:MAG: S1 RNA-binding domain-containing protein [Pirellulales bacterium]|nr:S1 RNA-binding domain-containing protein [Pirellulales bacterium]
MSESPNQPTNHSDDQAQSEQTAPPVDSQADSTEQTQQQPERESDPTKRGQRVLIGSQRDAAAVHMNKKRDWYVPGQNQDKDVAEKDSGKKDADEQTPTETAPVETAPTDTAPVETAPVESEEPQPVEAATQPAETTPPAPAVEETATEADIPAAEPPAARTAAVDTEDTDDIDMGDIDMGGFDKPTGPVPVPGRHFPPPNIRSKLPPELEDELNQALGDASIDDLMSGSDSVTSQELLEPESRHTGRVVAVQRDDVFVELGAREQGIVPLKLFEEPPKVGEELKVIVTRFNREDGVYDLLVPNASADVSDWSDLMEGMIVTATVTGHNTGGLECEVNKIRGFIPVSHISLYRVENLEEFVGEKFICLVTEADPERRNLVLSRRAVLEKEKEEARKELLASLEVGQIHEGVVRKIMDFGAFVDIGGVDGLVHISQLAWGRVEHPSEVLTEGQTIKVKILKMDENGNRIGLGYRDMIESPWTDIENKYPVNALVKGKVSKLMEFGAFIELEPGVEGLAHISELSHKRIWRTSDAVSEGQEVEVMIKSVDTKAQRIGLSLKDALPELKTEEKEEETDLPEAAVSKAPANPSKPLKGGLGDGAGGEKFGLKW